MPCVAFCRRLERAGDRAPRWGEGVSRVRPDRYAQRHERAGDAGPDGAGEGPVFRPCFLLQGSPRRFNQGALLGYAGAVPVRQASGERTLHLAVAGGWGGAADGGAAIDALGGDRLAGAAVASAAGMGVVWVRAPGYSDLAGTGPRRAPSTPAVELLSLCSHHPPRPAAPATGPF